LPQAEVLEGMLAEKGIKLNAVLEIQVPDEIIMERILGRYACMKCGAGYHEKFHKPKIYGVCDECGGTEFTKRKDDNRATVMNRLVNYRLLTYPTIPFFEKRGLLKTVDGTGTIAAVSKKIDEVLGLNG
jgi:adenylate kinase